MHTMGSQNEPVPQGSATFIEGVLPSQQADMNPVEPNRAKRKFGNPAALYDIEPCMLEHSTELPFAGDSQGS